MNFCSFIRDPSILSDTLQGTHLYVGSPRPAGAGVAARVVGVLEFFGLALGLALVPAAFAPLVVGGGATLAPASLRLGFGRRGPSANISRLHY